MNESGDQQQQRVGSSVNPKIASDSGYGSNKSTQRSSGSSKSHESSVSSESSTAYPPHPNAPVSITECQSHQAASPGQGGSTKRQGKQKKGDRKLSSADKTEVRLSIETTKDSNKSGTLAQSMDQTVSASGNAATTPTGSQQQLSQSQIMSPGSRASSTHDSKALQMAALTQVLSCMKKFHKPLTDSEIHQEENEEMETIPGKKWQEYFSNDIKIDDNCNEDTFASVVSLDDGIVLFITPTISNILGFPKDMLVGRNFIDFIHPKDRMAFASHITCGMSLPMGEQQQQQQQHQQQHNSPSQGSNPNASTGTARVKSEPFYCRLRQYRGLKTVGFGVIDKTVHYYPFKLTMTLKKVENSQKDSTGVILCGEYSSRHSLGGNSDHPVRKGHQQGNSKNSSATSMLINEYDSGNNSVASPANGVGGGNDTRIGISSKKPNLANNNSNPNFTVHLVIVANRIKSQYQFPDEAPLNPGKFVTRHSASCHFDHMDSEAISYLGHLPQDLIGNSVLDYYHPEDMGLMKDIYEGVMQEQGKPFRSKPYRFRVYNGTFAMLETDWSCFINPWSWKLEFVIGQHRVIQGPGKPNVFMQPNDETDYLKNAPVEILEESKEIQSEIKKLLTEVRKTTVNTVTRRLSDPLRQQSSRRRKDLAALMETLLEGMAKTENSEKSGCPCSDVFSVMERDSVMLGEISPHHDDQSGSNQSSETPPSYNQLNYRENIERFFHSQPKTKHSDESAESSKMETNQSAIRSSDSDSKSSPNIDSSSGSNVRISSGGSNENESGDRDICASPLTEERLSRHNEAMEKYMIQRHRVLRGKSSMTPGSHKESRHKHSEKVYTPLPVTSSSSLSNDNGKSSYYIKQSRCQRRTKCKHRNTQCYTPAEMSHGVKRTGNDSWDGDTHTAKQPHLECIPRINTTMTAATSGACCPGQNTINLWPPFSIATTPGIATSTYRSAGAPAASVARNIPTSFPGVVPQCCNPNSATGVKPVASRNGIRETISMSATTPSAPLLFLPSAHHQHPHIPHQFVPQPVQLFPAGVVYQPLGSCIYGQPSPFIMPAGFLGTMMHSGDQSVINQLESSSARTVSASQGEAFGTATLPKVFEKEKPGPSGAKPLKYTGSCNFIQGKNTLFSAVVGHSNAGPSKVCGSNSHHLSRSSVAHQLVEAVGRAGMAMTSAKHNATNISVPCQRQQIVMGREGSGSDESMNSTSVNTKDSMDEDKYGQSNSDQDIHLWSSRYKNVGEPRPNVVSVSTAGGAGSFARPRPTRNKQPAWLENVNVTSDLMYRYRIPTGDLSDVLQKDMEALKIFGKQSSMVNDQLNMLYSELNFEGRSGVRPNFEASAGRVLNLEEGTTSNSSSGDENSKDNTESQKNKKPVASHLYSKMAILYEENAPFPPDMEVSASKREAEV